MFALDFLQLRQLEEEKAVSERMLAELRAKHEAIEKREVCDPHPTF